jgi:NADP-dependent 3-hydroxy acid dehydrogenase YdfG
MKTTMIMGGTQGLGLAIAHELANSGFNKLPETIETLFQVIAEQFDRQFIALVSLAVPAMPCCPVSLR